MTDLISRADAIEAVIEYWDGYAKPLDSWDVMNQTRAVLETLPSAVCDDCIWTVCNYNKVDWDALPSAEATIGDYPNDLISRSALMEYCSNQKSKTIDNNDIARFPSAEAVQGWIPCSERLPSESGWYVISVVGFENITDVSYFYSDEAKWSDVSHTQSVVAWMPLPKPYKGGEDE